MLDDIDLDIPEDDDEIEIVSAPRRSFVTIAGILGAILVIALIGIGVYAIVLLPQRQAAEQEQLFADTSTAAALADLITPSETHTPSATPRPSASNTTIPNTATSTASAVSDTPGPTDEGLADSGGGEELSDESSGALATFTEDSGAASATPTPLAISSATSASAGAIASATPVTSVASSTNNSNAATQTATVMPTVASQATQTATVMPTVASQANENLLTQAAQAQTQAVSTLNSPTLTPTVTPPSALPDSGFGEKANAPGLLLSAALLMLVIIFSRRLRRSFQ